MKDIVVHHSADYDGIFCREIAKRFIPNATLIGWDFADPPLPIDLDARYLVVDLPPDVPFSLRWHSTTNPYDTFRSFIWVDHHKTAIDRIDFTIPGYRIDGVAACRLLWQYFIVNNVRNLATKDDFINRKVNEPWAVRLAGEYDIWDKRDPNAETFQYALRINDVPWKDILDDNMEVVQDMLFSGTVCQSYAKRENASIVNHKSFMVVFEGLKFLCVNTARFNSLLFEAKDVPETGHDALMGFVWLGDKYTVSLYHAKHRTDLDLSPIAVKYGGGGHRGACGFTATKLPFLP